MRTLRLSAIIALGLALGYALANRDQGAGETDALVTPAALAP